MPAGKTEFLLDYVMRAEQSVASSKASSQLVERLAVSTLSPPFILDSWISSLLLSDTLFP